MNQARINRFLTRAFPEVDTITLGQWRARVAAGPAPLPAAVDRRPRCGYCGGRYERSPGPRHDFCSRTCRLRWHATRRRGPDG